MRVGSGLVTLALPETLIAPLAGPLAEATFLPLPAEDSGDAGRVAAERVLGALDRYAALLVGPGLGRGERARVLLERLLFGGADGSPFAGRAVVDADGLNWLADQPGWETQLSRASLVLTPHPGELSRLTGRPREAIQAKPWEAAREAAERFGQVVVLKQSHPVVAAPGHPLIVAPQSEPALASAGTGDTLAGTIAGFLAQGLPPREAATAGLYVASTAAERAVARRGTLGLLAGDIVEELPAAAAWFYDPHWRKEEGGWRSTWTWPAS
jgi:NAD(P)H-hydrate epimerase